MTRTIKTTLTFLAATLLMMGAAGFAQTPVPIAPPDEAPPDTAAPGPMDTVKQASYGIFSIAPSPVAGYMQVRQTPEGMAEFVLTLTNSDPGDLHAAAVYEGDCAPDRPMAVSLGRIGDSLPEDPFVSITTTDIAYQNIVDGDYFVMIFGPELDTTPLACGEVGTGANRTDY